MLIFALATAYRLPCEQDDTGKEPVGWQHCHRQLFEQTWALVRVFANDCYGAFHIREYSLLLEVDIKNRRAVVGTHRRILATQRLIAYR
jgi:hypothetical protein